MDFNGVQTVQGSKDIFSTNCSKGFKRFQTMNENDVVKLMFIAFLKFHVCYDGGVECLSRVNETVQLLYIYFQFYCCDFWLSVYHKGTKQILILQLIDNLTYQKMK